MHSVCDEKNSVKYGHERRAERPLELQSIDEPAPPTFVSSLLMQADRVATRLVLSFLVETMWHPSLFANSPAGSRSAHFFKSKLVTRPICQTAGALA